MRFLIIGKKLQSCAKGLASGLRELSSVRLLDALRASKAPEGKADSQESRLEQRGGSMELDEIFETFRDRAAEMEFSRIMVRETSKAELKRFAELMGTTSDEDDNAFPRFMSKQSVRFYDPESGVSVAYGFRESVAEDRMRQIVKHQNRQYGWLLVTVYEEFEDFIERTYAWVGKRDWKCWRLKDFGNVKFQDLEGKPFDWFLERVRRAYGSDPKAILNRLRDLYPRLARVEKK